MESLPHKTYPRNFVFLLLLLLAILALHAWHYLPFIADDALISLRYSKRLIDGHGLNWNSGERVEGYSNLLWVLAAAALGFARIDLVDAVRILGFVCMAATVAAVFFANALRNVKTVLLFFLVTLFLPLAAPIAVWTIGGMEQPLVAVLLAWAIVFCFKGIEQPHGQARVMLLPGLMLGLLCLTRLDGPLFTAAAVLAFLMMGPLNRGTWLRVFYLMLLPVVLTLAQVVFRLVYYGEWIPNTALVKFTPSGKHSLDGWSYLLNGARPIIPLLLLAIFSIFVSFWWNFRRDRMILLCSLGVSWMVYLVIIGGDIFPAWRHFVPLLVIFVMMVGITAEWISQQKRAASFATALTICVVFLTVFVWLQFRDDENLRAISERWEWDGKAVGTMLKEAFGPQQPLMAIDPAGCLPYWSELPSLDMLGLNDYHLPRNPPANLGQGAVGHELGDGQYVLDRKPDLVIFLLPTGAEHGYFPSGKQMQRDPRFFRDYTLTYFETNEPHKVLSRIWVRRDSERIGIKRTDSEISIPAFLFNDNRESRAKLNSSGKIVVPLTVNNPARIANLEIPPGRWQIATSAWPLWARVSTSPDAKGASGSPSAETVTMLLDAQLPATLELKDTSTVRIDMELRSTSSVVELSELVLRRLPD
jgi:arabinofuranosyltransferase